VRRVRNGGKGGHREGGHGSQRPGEGDRWLPQFGARASYLKPAIDEWLIEHRHYIARYGGDMPGISG
jgi:hypothetical protein